MELATVNVSFQEDLLTQIDRFAENEARTRSDLIVEATKLYISRKEKWEKIFAYGEELPIKYNFTENDVNEEIKKYRGEKNGKNP